MIPSKNSFLIILFDSVYVAIHTCANYDTYCMYIMIYKLCMLVLLYMHTEICPELTDPPNGRVNYTSITFSSLAHYTCNDGYRINGASVLQCLRGGLWNNTPPTCQGSYSIQHALQNLIVLYIMYIVM